MEKMDGKIAKSVVIFVKKANMYYVLAIIQQARTGAS
jgi:DNA-binding protein